MIKEYTVCTHQCNFIIFSTIGVYVIENKIASYLKLPEDDRILGPN